MRLVHTIKCVSCGAVEYMAVEPGAKSARVMNGICDKCDGFCGGDMIKSDGGESGVSAKENESKAKQAGVPKGRARSA